VTSEINHSNNQKIPIGQAKRLHKLFDSMTPHYVSKLISSRKQQVLFNIRIKLKEMEKNSYVSYIKV